jgi:hypothetical protein
MMFNAEEKKMWTIDDILDRLVLIGGSPRSGTSFAAKSLNSHPRILTAVDDQVYECWTLYNYQTRDGIVEDLRNPSRTIRREEVIRRLQERLISNGYLSGIAPSKKTEKCVSVPLPNHNDVVLPAVETNRILFPIDRLGKEWRFCLKSPEISYVLPQLVALFPKARFVLIYRPIIEIAESMYRKGMKVKKVPVFHKRWDGERDKDGELVPPPGIPGKWMDLWRQVNDFQRCVINAASYLRAFLKGAKQLPKQRFLVYNHAHLRESPWQVFNVLASFLEVDSAGFQPAIESLKRNAPEIPFDLLGAYQKMEKVLDLKKLMQNMENLK